MYFLRIAGAASLLISGIVGARVMNASISKKWEQTEALIALMRFAKIQIECFGLPAPEIIARSDPRIISACGFCGDTLPDSFDELFRGCGIRDGEIGEILRTFAAGFGRGYREEQVRECEYYIELMCERRQILQSDLPKRRKLNSTLCISSALAIVILLL